MKSNTDTIQHSTCYDFEARQPDSKLGCFTSIDPKSEKYYSTSPYAYCAGDPINFVDPDGNQPVKYIDSNGNKHISWSIVIMVKAPKADASEKKIEKHEAYKKSIAESYKDQFNHFLNGDGEGALNSKGERVFSSFNITVVDVENTKDIGTAGKLSCEYSQDIKDSDKTKNGSAAVFAEGSTEGAQGLTKGGYRITIAIGAPEGTESHELFHTSGIKDNGYQSGGILNSPPEPIAPKEVDDLWNIIPEKK